MGKKALNTQNIIENMLVWIEVRQKVDGNTLLLQSSGDEVYVIVNGCVGKASPVKIYTEKRFCPFCNQSAKFEAKVCQNCAEKVTEHTSKCHSICQYGENGCDDCGCVYCRKLGYEDN